MANEGMVSVLNTFSSELAELTAQAGESVVRVDDGSRLTATGVIWTEDGLIVTTSHGVERDEELIVELGNGNRLPATLVGRDGDTDLALLRVSAAGLTPIPQADEVKVGHLVLAVARPGQGGLQATLGLVTSRRESQSGGQAEYVLQTDATLYPGFSGGALVDMQGRMVGLTNLAFGRGRGVAVGVPTIANAVKSIQGQGKPARGYLGVRMQPVALPETAQKAAEGGQERALLIVGLEPGSPAEQGGLLLGDTILAINDALILEVDDLRKALRQIGAGQMAHIRLLRGGERRDVSVTLGAEN